jgi:hypothetical protein
VNRSGLVVALVVTFLMGSAAGLMGGMVLVHHMHGERGPFGMGRRHERPTPHEAMMRLQRLLDLTPEQVAKIEPKVAESQRQFEAARESLHSRIDAELTVVQRARWARFRREHPFPGPQPPDDQDSTHRAGPGEEGEK